MDHAITHPQLDRLFGSTRPTRWVTREHPKIDRIACPWLIRRFIDPDAEIIYVPTEEVFRTAESLQAEPFDIPGATLSHRGDFCSFDAFVADFNLDAEGLAALATIVRGADTDRYEIAPEAAGLHAISIGMASLIQDDHQLLEQGMLVYDALLAGVRAAGAPHHAWIPESS